VLDALKAALALKDQFVQDPHRVSPKQADRTNATPGLGGRSRATLVMDTRSIHVMGERHGSIKNGGGRFTFARVGE
jgi:hypothetical protein